MIQNGVSKKPNLKKRRLLRVITRLLREIGEDLERPGLEGTPERVAKAFAEWYRGYEKPPFDVKVFKTGYKGLVVRPCVPFQSFCEHHMARYAGTISFAYIPSGQCIGLSKIIRLIQHWTARLSIQEDLTDMIVENFKAILKTDDIAIVVSAFHSCESTRGVRVAGVPTVTSRLSGRFFTDAALRDEFYKLIKTEIPSSHL